jgi:NCS1 nucleoside transporter family
MFDGLNLEAASLTILFFSLLGAIPPAALGTLGPQTGLRQMVQRRYNFGLYAVGIVALLNLATTTGWTIVSAIVASQTLSTVSGGSLSWAVGIVIISLAGITISFMGYKVAHTDERFAWIPALIAVVIMVGCGGHLLKLQSPAEPVKAQAVLTYGCVLTGFLMSWATMVSDFCVYIHPAYQSECSLPFNICFLAMNRTRIFIYTYAGLLLPIVPLMCLGAAIGGGIVSVPEWTAVFSAHSTDGVVNEMLTSAGGFGRFVAVVLAFSVLGNIAGPMYSISVQFQILLPVLGRVPRFVFSILITALVIAVAIPVSHTFESSLENFLGVISYWVAIFVGIISTEHLYFRKGNAASYNLYLECRE